MIKRCLKCNQLASVGHFPSNNSPYCNQCSDDLKTQKKCKKCYRIKSPHEFTHSSICRECESLFCLKKGCKDTPEIQGYCEKHSKEERYNLEQMQNGKSKFCLVEGCTNKPFKKGICFDHSDVFTFGKCISPLCKNKVYKKDLCRRHFIQKDRSDSNVTEGNEVEKRCYWPLCERNVYRKHLCKKHYEEYKSHFLKNS